MVVLASAACWVFVIVIAAILHYGWGELWENFGIAPCPPGVLLAIEVCAPAVLQLFDLFNA